MLQDRLRVSHAANIAHQELIPPALSSTRVSRIVRHSIVAGRCGSYEPGHSRASLLALTSVKKSPDWPGLYGASDGPMGQQAALSVERRQNSASHPGRPLQKV